MCKLRIIVLSVFFGVLFIESYGQNTMHFHQAIGKNVENIEVKKVIEKFNISDTTEIPTGYFYNSRKQGVSFKFDKQSTLSHIFLYKEGVDGFRQYVGNCPKGLSFNMTRSQVEALLGKPIRKGGGTYSNIYAIYKGGISITYSTISLDDLSAKIEVINLIEE